MLSFIGLQPRSNSVGPPVKRSRKSKTIRLRFGYALLALSLIMSVSALVSSARHTQIAALIIKSPVAADQQILPIQVKAIKISATSRTFAKQLATSRDLSRMKTKVALNPGHLIELSDLAAGSTSAHGYQMALGLSASQAPLNTIVFGSHLELVSTVGTGSSATSQVVASAAKVIGVYRSPNSASTLSQQSEVVLLSLTNPLEPIAIAQAEVSGSIVAVLVAGPHHQSLPGTFSFSRPRHSPANSSVRQPSGIQLN